MANKIYEETSIQNIANSIRTKNGTATTYKVNEMSSAVSSLQCLHENTQTQNPLNIKGIGCLKDYKVYGNAIQVRLPKEYQEVEYIKSTGTQYIDTGVIPNNTTGFRIKMSVPDVTSDIFRFGCRQNSADTRFVLGTDRGTAYYGFGLNYNNESVWTITNNTPFVSELNYKNSRIATTNDLGGKNIGDISSITFTYSIIMFGRNNAGSIAGSAQTIYSCEITQGTDVIRNYIPCYRKSDNVIGMYDTVNDVFYDNDGTGTFLKGNDYVDVNPDNPIEITSVGTLVQSGEYAGKYKIDVVSTADTSEPYHTPITTPIYLDKPLYKIGNVSDYIDFGNKKVVRGIGEVTLNGSETGWNQRASGVNCYRGYRIPNCRAVWATQNSYTNYFAYNVDNAYNGRNGYGIDGNAQILIGIDNVSTVNDFKNWLSTHNTKVVYELTSPTEESISLPDIPLFNDIHTIIEVDNATGMYGKYWEVL